MATLEELPPPSDRIRELVSLGRYFAERRMHGEAAELFALALRLDPAQLEARRGLAEARRAQQVAERDGPPTLEHAVQEELRRHAIDGAHFIGLAHLYALKQDEERALECLRLAAEKAPSNPQHHKLKGLLMFRRGDFDEAVEELSRALRLNPFDSEVAATLGRAEFGRRKFERAVGPTLHAYLLQTERDSEVAERLRRRILSLKHILSWSNEELHQQFQRRRRLLDIAFDRLEWHRERLLEEGSLTRGQVRFGASPRRHDSGLIDLASRLRKLAVFGELSDRHLLQLTAAVQEELHHEDSLIFGEGADGRDLYVVEQGEVAIRRATSYGNFRLSRLRSGELMGEVGFLTGRLRSADAVTTRPSLLLRFDAVELGRVITASPELAVQLYWSLWHTLARKLRRTNEQLRSFFTDEAPPDTVLRLAPAIRGKRVEVAAADKVRLFREQGLTSNELLTLATYSRERRYAAGQELFREGDGGEEMYVVLSGKVLISKFIPGAGEEALAILGRGELFGEMSLLDGEPRSADARAHDGPLTVLALDERTVREVLSLDADAALELLELLCRLLARRLIEIDEKVVGWRILTGGSDLPMAVG